MREFRIYEKAYAMVYGKRKLVMVIKQSETWTKSMICGGGGPWSKPIYARVKSDTLLPLPCTSRHERT